MSINKFIRIRALMAILFLAGLVCSLNTPTVHAKNGPAYKPGELLVQFRDNATENVKDKVKKQYGASKKETIKAKGDGMGDLELLNVTSDVPALAAQLSKDPSVEFAEPNWLAYKAQTAPTPFTNDPYFSDGHMWDMYSPTSTPSSQYGTKAAAAWARGYKGSANIVVGVIDEGIDINHPDLQGQIWVNQAEAKGKPGVDDDRNGYIDDINGWDFVNNDNTVFDGDGVSGVDHHGTHVAGTIGAKANNSEGVVGVNWNIQIVPLKFLGEGGSTMAMAIKAVDYLTNLRTKKGLNVVAANNSWVAGGYSSGLYNALVRARSANILHIAAAGNGSANNDTSAVYPANYNLDNVISVASIDPDGTKSTWSNYGRTTVDLAAPGAWIWSTAAKDGVKYSEEFGTSMATPHVTGAVALYASVYPGRTYKQIRQALLSSTAPTPALNGLTVTNGRLDIAKMLGIS
jgi:subtilisin family serine protease